MIVAAAVVDIFDLLPIRPGKGAAAGADAYIVKGRFDQDDLVQTIGRLL